MIPVTRPFLPPLEEFNEYLSKIRESKVLTNGGEFHQQFEQQLCEYLGVKHISLFAIGNNVRIDDFYILSGKLTLCNNIHISSFCALYGSNGIIMNDFSGLSPRTTIFSASDDFTGE